jgi:hypothetical protein
MDIIEKADLDMRLVKILDIGYISVIYFILGLIISRLFDKYYGKFDKKNYDNKSIYTVGTELVVLIWIIGIVIYIVRNLAQLIPSPFDGINGFKHNLVKELGSAAVFTMIVMSYTYYFKNKLEYFNQRLNKEFSINV